MDVGKLKDKCEGELKTDDISKNTVLKKGKVLKNGKVIVSDKLMKPSKTAKPSVKVGPEGEEEKIKSVQQELEDVKENYKLAVKKNVRYKKLLKQLEKTY